MKQKLLCLLVLSLSLASVSFGQLETEGKGFRWQELYFNPSVSTAATHDNRVFVLGPNNALEDEYGELAVGIGVKNLPARYDFSAGASYGYRWYSQYQILNDDFYKANIMLGTSEGRLNWKLSADEAKSLNYNTRYDPDSGAGPDSILVNTPNTRFLATGNVSYDAPVSERTSFVPEYAIQFYKQDFEGGTTTEWVEHDVVLPIQYAYSDKTLLGVGGAFSLQTNDDEEGYIASAFVEAQSRTTEKTTFGIMIGISGAEYELSGSDIGGVTDARFVWNISEKVQTYVFGGNKFQPGYGGGPARMVYRAGYGGKWLPVSQWFMEAQGLHDYQDAIGDTAGANIYGSVRHFFLARVGYKFVRWAEVSAEGRYINDDIDVDQVIASLRLDCGF